MNQIHCDFPKCLAWLALASLAACGQAGGETPSVGARTRPEERAVHFKLHEAAAGNLHLRAVEVGPRVLTGQRTYPGVVRYKESARASLVSQVEGIVREIDVTIGQMVRTTDVVCTLDSRELGQARARFLEALNQATFKEAMFAAEAKLWAKQITSRDSYMQAKQDVIEARLGLATAGQTLRSLGIGGSELEQLQERLSPESSDVLVDSSPLGRIHYAAPMKGEVVDVLVSRGEAISAGQGIIEVADLSTVWVDTHVPAHDLSALQVGDLVQVRWPSTGTSKESRLIYIAPEVDAPSQTALARVELANPDGIWRPGLFVSVDAKVQREAVDLAVPAEALVADPDVPGNFLVFIERERGHYEAAPITVLRTDDGLASVMGDLHAGDRVVVRDTVFLKAVWLGEGGLEE